MANNGLYDGFDFAGRAARAEAQARAKERIPLLVAEYKSKALAGQVVISRDNIVPFVESGDFIGAEQYMIRVLRDLPEVEELDRDLRGRGGMLREAL